MARVSATDESQKEGGSDPAASNAPLPNERDATHEPGPAPTREGLRDIMQQAHDDIESGQQDTDLYSQPGLEKPGPEGHRKDP